MRRIIIHAGFHKTGTTSLQQTLRAFSVSRQQYDPGLVKYKAALLAETLHPETAATIVISPEDLSGHMPGRHGLHGYGAAPDLMRTIAEAFKAVAPDDTFSFFFTTRAAEPWLRSFYTQHLRAARMIWDKAGYCKRLRTSAELDRIISLIRRALPDAIVATAAMEDHAQRPHGITDTLLDHIEMDNARRGDLASSGQRNLALTPDVLNAFLPLNRSDLDQQALRTAKPNLIEGAA